MYTKPIVLHSITEKPNFVLEKTNMVKTINDEIFSYTWDTNNYIKILES